MLARAKRWISTGRLLYGSLMPLAKRRRPRLPDTLESTPVVFLSSKERKSFTVDIHREAAHTKNVCSDVKLAPVN